MSRCVWWAVVGLIVGLPATVSAQVETQEHRPVYSPDGTSVVFMRQSEKTVGDWELYQADASGAAVRRLTQSVGWDGYAVFSPDGNRLVFDRSLDGTLDNKAPHLMDLATGQATRLGQSEGWLSVSDWSRTHGLLAFWERGGQRDLYFVDEGGGIGRRLTNTPDVSEHDAHFSPSGDAIVFASGPANGEGRTSLEVMGTEGGDRRVLLESIGRLYGAAWSPDGTRIAYTDAPDDDDADLFVIDTLSGRISQLTDHPAWDHMPVWRADGQALLFSSYRSGPERLYTFDLASGQVQTWAAVDPSGTH